MPDHEPLDLPGIERTPSGTDDGGVRRKRQPKTDDPASYSSKEFPAGVLERIIERQKNDPKFQAKLKVIRDYQRAYERGMP